ncbi:hypothetical protein chiPu_0030262, partial [Chiloscyllium punctatum]|nr:hypothetical protein [Chiloscyllium punctatum]
MNRRSDSTSRPTYQPILGPAHERSFPIADRGQHLATGRHRELSRPFRAAALCRHLFALGPHRPAQRCCGVGRDAGATGGAIQGEDCARRGRHADRFGLSRRGDGHGCRRHLAATGVGCGDQGRRQRAVDAARRSQRAGQGRLHQHGGKQRNRAGAIAAGALRSRSRHAVPVHRPAGGATGRRRSRQGRRSRQAARAAR